MNLENKILIAQILAPFGIKGWLKIKSFADPHENISTYKNFEILIDDCLEKIEIENITFENKKIFMNFFFILSLHNLNKEQFKTPGNLKLLK